MIAMISFVRSSTSAIPKLDGRRRLVAVFVVLLLHPGKQLQHSKRPASTAPPPPAPATSAHYYGQLCAAAKQTENGMAGLELIKRITITIK